MKTTNIASHLGRTALFRALDENSLTELASQVTERSYRRGQLIVQQGDMSDFLGIIIEGLAKVSVVSSEGIELVFATLGPNESFGELAFLDGGPRSASVEAILPCRVLTVSRALLTESLRKHPEVVEAVMTSLGGVVRRLTGQASDLVFLNLDARLAKLLASLARQHGKAEDDGIVLDLQISQSDLANMIGASRPSINQALKSFVGRGYIEVRRNQVVVKALEELERRGQS